jgi:release factor glutamine methyltransferase
MSATETWTTLRVLDWTSKRFTEAGLGAARLEAQVLLAFVLGCNRTQLYTGFDKPLSADELASFRGLIRRRLAGEPLAYLVGDQEFWSLAFTVVLGEARVLVPRHDTETLIEVVLDELKAAGRQGEALRVADIGTGSGAIAVTLAKELAASRVIAVDLDDGAIAIARHNVERHGLGERVEVRQGDLLGPLAGEEPFDVLAANLPYIADADMAGLPPEVKAEPRRALVGGPDGLDLVRRLVSGAPDVMRPGALIALEHGFDQAEAVRAILAAQGGFEEARTRKDLGGQPRITYARRRTG